MKPCFRHGKELLAFGENPQGVNIFTEDGRFAQIQIAGGIPKFASNSRVTGTAEENKAVVVVVVQGSLAIFGTHTIDEATKVITRKLESSTYPNWIGLEQKLQIDSLTADDLRISNLVGSVAGASLVNTWKRAK